MKAITRVLPLLNGALCIYTVWTMTEFAHILPSQTRILALAAAINAPILVMSLRREAPRFAAASALLASISYAGMVAEMAMYRNLDWSLVEFLLAAAAAITGVLTLFVGVPGVRIQRSP